MTTNLRILNDNGLELFEKFISQNRRTFGKKFPTNLLDENSEYSEPTNILIDFDTMQGMHLWEIGKDLLYSIDNEENQKKLLTFNTENNLDYKNLWASLSLYLNEEIRPLSKQDTYDIGIYEESRYIITSGQKRYRHLLYSAYLSYKCFGDESKFIITKNHSHSTATDRFFGRNASLRYPEIFPIIKRFYNDNQKIEDLITMIKIIAMNTSLHGITEDELMDLLPAKLKERLEI